MIESKKPQSSVGYLLALIVSLLLLGFISFREVQITYPTFAVENLIAQGDIVKNSLRPFINEGLTLEQFPGFEPLTDPLLASDTFLVGIMVRDAQSGEIILSNRSDPHLNAKINYQDLKTSIIDQGSADFSVTENPFLYQVSIPLTGKFGPVGELLLLADRQLILQQVANFFQPVFISISLIILFSIPVLWLMNWRWPEMSWPRLLFGGFYFIATLVLVGVLVNVYTEGINRKANTLTQSLANRILFPIQYGLEIGDFSGIDTLIDSYLELDPDIGYITLASADDATQAEVILYSTDAAQIGQTFTPNESFAEHHYLIQRENESVAAKLDVFLGIPLSIVYTKLWDGVRNFLILFVACAFLASLIFSLNTSLTQHFSKEESKSDLQGYLLGLIGPLYFLIVFAEGLHASFLPQYIQTLAVQDGFNPSQTSVIFTIYFLGFVAALLPSGWIAEKFGIRPLLISGSIVYMGSMIALALIDGFVAMYPIRLLAGVSQGILYIAVQGYILSVAKKGKTSAAGIIVFGYNGGVISGTALGSLLAAYLSYEGAFLVGAGIASLFTIYTAILIPKIERETAAEEAQTEPLPLKQKLIQMGQDWRFIKTMLLIGIPTKAVLTGVTGYALQLVLTDNGYGHDEIGQLLILYAGGVLISSQYVSKLVDRTGRTDEILFWGGIVSGLGLVLIGQLGAPFLADVNIPMVGTLVLIAGLLVLGVAHGFIHAPVVTHIAETDVAKHLGKSSTTSIYRTFERLGHVNGPIIVSYLLTFSSRPGETFALIGAILVGFAVLFRLEPGRLWPAAGRSNRQLSIEKGGVNG